MIESGPSAEIVFTTEGPSLTTPPETTGRFIVVFAEGTDAPATVLQETAGLRDVAHSHELRGDTSQVTTTDTVFDQLGMAVVDADPDQVGALRSVAERKGGQVLAFSPELVHHVRGTDYAQGYADGALDLGTRLGANAVTAPTSTGRGPVTGDTAGGQAFQDTADFTWGIQATRADRSSATGAGIRVAVLDTGFDSAHPDFAGRNVTMQSFIDGESAEDGHGHGTHCIGTSCGPKSPESGPRYGVAHEAEIHVGKVLSNAGSGSDGGILAGIDWAIQAGCTVISMSLGADVPRVHPPYAVAGQRALDRGSLIVAAAGNNAARSRSDFGFVGAPANSPYVMAVGALTQQLAVADFSARTLDSVQGGQVDLAGPGYQVYSSWPMPTRYRTISGTSMATPHVAGLAALWAQTTGYRGRELWSVLVQDAQRLLAPSVDVGSGLALAP